MKHVEKTQTRRRNDFPVLVQGARIAGAASEKETFSGVPLASCAHVFVSPEMRDEADDWLSQIGRESSQPPKEVKSMERFGRAAVLLSLIEKLRDGDSWCGETHVQKGTYFLQDLLGVPLEFDFILYKHGPFSFDLSDEISWMRANDLLRLQPQQRPYGPKLIPGENAELLKKTYPQTNGTVCRRSGENHGENLLYGCDGFGEIRHGVLRFPKLRRSG